MGLFDDGFSIISGSHHGRTKHLKLKRRSRSRSKEREKHGRGRERNGLEHHHGREAGSRERRSRSRSLSRSRGIDTMTVVGSVLGVDHLRHRAHEHRAGKHLSPARGFWPWLGLGRHRSGFFGFNRPSYYRRSSRHGFVQRTLRKAKHLLRTLSHYAQRHPLKVFMLVILPLVTTGALGALLARFGLRLPPALERMLGVAGKMAAGDSLGLVGEAVRLAGDVSGSRSVHISSSRKVDSGGSDLAWERSSVDSEGGFGSSLFNIAKRFV